MLAEELAHAPKYSNYMTKEYISDLVRAAPLHDIGKIGVPDSILLKSAKLTDAEFTIMQEHCELGAQVLRKADEKLQFQSFLNSNSTHPLPPREVGWHRISFTI